MIKGPFFTSERPRLCGLWSCRGVCGALHCLLGGVIVGFGSRLCGRIVGVPVGAYCAPLVADLFLFCYERDFMLSLSDNNQADIIEAFGSASGCFGGLFGIDNPCFELIVGQMYPTELKLNRASSSDAVVPFLNWSLSVAGGMVSSEICGKRGGLGFGIVGFPFFEGDVPRSSSYGVCVSWLVRFAGMCSGVGGFGS